MIVRKIFSRTLFLSFVGILIIMMLCINELFTGTDLSHPMWDKSYNWFALLKDILLVSFTGGLLGEAAKLDNLIKYKQPKTTTSKGGYQYGH